MKDDFESFEFIDSRSSKLKSKRGKMKKSGKNIGQTYVNAVNKNQQ